MRRLGAALLVLALLSCSSPAIRDDPSTTSLPDAPSNPEETVRVLLDALAEEDFAAAAELTVPGQPVVVALIEGIPVAEARTLVDAGAQAVAAGFWEAFVEGLADFLGRGPVDVGLGEVTRFVVDGVDFARVELTVVGDPARRGLVLREQQGWRVDLLASFPAALAGKVAPVVQAVRSHPDPGPLPDILAAQRPSLEAVLEDPELTPEVRQAVITSLVAFDR